MKNKKPCIVETTQGFSVLYNDKLLYSKYNPARNILSVIENLTLLPGTLVLCFSPVLGYGLKELSSKLPENSFLLGIELETSLLEFINTNSNNHSQISNFSMLTIEEAYELPSLLSKNNIILKSGVKLPSPGTFKRAIFIDFSAGVSLHKDLYQKIYSFSVNSIMTFWKNRITLTKFGRKYSHNFFSNLKNLDKTIPIQNYLKSITKPIVIFGSGESIDDGIKYIKQNKEKFYILCADTALQPLLDNSITPNGVFIEEAQNIILKAFIGTKNYDFTIFAGLSSISQLSHNFPLNKLSFFTTEYVQANFITNLISRDLLPQTNMPFGSVGLTVFYYALQFRKDSTIPIYTYGLDFAYTAGRTHGKGTLAHKNTLIALSRLNSIYNFSSSYNNDSICFTNDFNEKIYSSPLLLSYASLFVNLFGNNQYENVYNSSKVSNVIKLPHKLPEPLIDSNSIVEIQPHSFDENKINLYFTEERKALLYLKDILTGKTKLSSTEIETEIKKVTSEREYLYLHFPDGHHFSYTQDFLNRIRIEIDYFLKIFN